MEHLEEYKKHCIDQAITILTAGHDIKCMFTTPNFARIAGVRFGRKGTSIQEIESLYFSQAERNLLRNGLDSCSKLLGVFA